MFLLTCFFLVVLATQGMTLRPVEDIPPLEATHELRFALRQAVPYARKKISGASSLAKNDAPAEKTAEKLELLSRITQLQDDQETISKDLQKGTCTQTFNTCLSKYFFTNVWG